MIQHKSNDWYLSVFISYISFWIIIARLECFCTYSNIFSKIYYFVDKSQEYQFTLAKPYIYIYIYIKADILEPNSDTKLFVFVRKCESVIQEEFQFRIIILKIQYSPVLN